MTEIAQTYLGNIDRNPDLAELVAIESCLEVYLAQDDRTKGRIHAKTSNGETVGIIKSRDLSLQSGDIFQTESKKLLLVHLQKQEVLILDFSAIQADLLPTQLVHLGHILGNNHCPITIKDNKVYLQLASNNIAIKKTIEDLKIINLKMYSKMSGTIIENAHSTHQHH